MFCRKDVLRNLAKFTGKHLCQSLFLNKVAGLKRDSNTGVSCESFELSRNTYVEEHPRTAASIYWLGIGITCKKIFCYMRDSCYSVQVVYCLLKKRLWHKCFPVNLVKFLRTLFFTEHLWWLFFVFSPALINSCFISKQTSFLCVIH